MCTVSVVSHADGLRVMANRDERRDRAVASQPRIAALGSRTATMPIDPTGGGSWIGVNDAGLVAVVLNRHRGPIPAADIVWTSRGALVPLALRCDSVEAAIGCVRQLEATRFRPFRLVLVQRRDIALIAGDAQSLECATSTLAAPYMFTASSLGDFLVEGPRRRLFDWLMTDPDARLRGQSLFHRHQWSGMRDISVLMDRPDAATVSRTTIDLGPDGITLEYESLVPAEAPRRIELQKC